MKTTQCLTFSKHKRQAKNKIQNHNRLAFAQLHQGQGQPQGSQFFSSVRSYCDAAMRSTTTAVTAPPAGGHNQGLQGSSTNPVGPGPFAFPGHPDIDEEFAGGEDFPLLPDRGIPNQQAGENNRATGERWSEQVERMKYSKEAIPPENPPPNLKMEEAVIALSEKVDKLGEKLKLLNNKFSSLTEEVRNAEEG